MLDDLPGWAFVGSVFEDDLEADLEILPNYADECIDWEDNEINKR